MGSIHAFDVGGSHSLSPLTFRVGGWPRLSPLNLRVPHSLRFSFQQRVRVLLLIRFSSPLPWPLSQRVLDSESIHRTRLERHRRGRLLSSHRNNHCHARFPTRITPYSRSPSSHKDKLQWQSTQGRSAFVLFTVGAASPARPYTNHDTALARSSAQRPPRVLTLH